MKSLIITILTIVTSTVFGQSFDKDLEKILIGNWKHVQSIYFNDSIATYTRTLQFNNDNTVICRTENGTAKGTWNIVDTNIYLYTKSGFKYELTDISSIDFLDTNKLFITNLIGNTKDLKKSHYIRI